jgi:hypothetical protein
MDFIRLSDRFSQPQNLSPPSKKFNKQESWSLAQPTAPFESRNPQSGGWGFDVEIAKIIAAKIGVPIEWKEMAFADLIPHFRMAR